MFKSSFLPRLFVVGMRQVLFEASVQAPQKDCMMRMPQFICNPRKTVLDSAALDANEIAVRVVPSSSHSTVTVTGRVTVDSSPYLRSALLQMLQTGTGSDVVVDLSGVSYLDMSGVATLLEALKAALQRSKTLHVLGMTGQSRMLAEIVELDKVFLSVGSEVEYR